MHKDLEIWEFAHRQLEQGVAVMLLIVAESSGSSPGRRGFKMIVTADDLCGSIGGGAMEVRLVEEARALLSADDSSSFIKEQVHQKNARHASGMICSGKQAIIFLKLQQEHSRGVRQIINSLRYGRGGLLVVKPNYVGRNPKLPNIRKEVVSFNIIGDGDFVYEEALTYKNKLIIIGGGHCALALSELMSRMDFHISLFDDRPHLNTIGKNKFAHKITIIESYEEISELISAGVDDFVVVMTLGYASDEVVIRKLFDREFEYFGVLGSKAKMKTLLRNLEKEGFSKEKLDRIRTPVGLPINSQTPEEIAVSIAAEIIAVKNSAK